jgi:Ser/Thr protein kinase RdoA (MazF antagonist)
MGDTLDKTILSNYDVGTVESVHRLSGGVENTNFRITCVDSEYVLRIYNDEHSIRGARSMGSIESELGFTMACKGLVPVAAPISNSLGHFVSRLPGKGFCALFAFVKGESVKAFDQQVVKEYAAVLDGLYEVSLNFKTSDREFRYDIVSRALATSGSFESDIPGVQRLVEKLVDKVGTLKSGLQDLPAGLVHGDIKLANTLFDHGRLTALLDFDDCRYSYLLEDTVMTIMHNLDQKDLNLLRSGYLETMLGSIANPKLIRDAQTSLRALIQARLLYDICKYARKDQTKLDEILDDPHVAPFLTD